MVGRSWSPDLLNSTRLVSYWVWTAAQGRKHEHQHQRTLDNNHMPVFCRADALHTYWGIKAAPRGARSRRVCGCVWTAVTDPRSTNIPTQGSRSRSRSKVQGPRSRCSWPKIAQGKGDLEAAPWKPPRAEDGQGSSTSRRGMNGCHLFQFPSNTTTYLR